MIFTQYPVVGCNSPDILSRNGRNGNMWQLERGSHPKSFCRKNHGWSSSKVLDMLLVLDSTGGQKGNPAQLDMLLVLDSTGGQKGNPAHTQQYLGLVKSKNNGPFLPTLPSADGVIQRHHQQEMLGLSRDSATLKRDSLRFRQASPFFSTAAVLCTCFTTSKKLVRDEWT